MKTVFKVFTLLVILVCVLSAVPSGLFASTMMAQTNVGRISGRVTDSSGAIVQGVTLTVTNDATSVARTVSTDDNGFYVVTNLPPGEILGRT